MANNSNTSSLGATIVDLLMKFWQLLIGVFIGILVTWIVIRKLPTDITIDKEVIPGVRVLKGCPKTIEVKNKVEHALNDQLLVWHQQLVQKGLNGGRTDKTDAQLEEINKAFFKLYLMVKQEIPNLCEDEQKDKDVRQALEDLDKSRANYMSKISTPL